MAGRRNGLGFGVTVALLALACGRPKIPTPVEKQSAHAIQMALDDSEVFIAMENGEVVAVSKASGLRRSVVPPSIVHPPDTRVRSIVDIKVSDAVYILDDTWALWAYSKRGSSTRSLVSQETRAGFVATPRGAKVMTFENDESELLGVFGEDLVVANLFAPHADRPSWFEVELALVRIGGGPRRPFARSESKVRHVDAAGGCHYWYETGWRGSDWGGGYGTCRLMAMHASGGAARAIHSVNSRDDFCDTDLRFTASSSAVFYIVADDGVLRSQPACGGAEAVVAKGLGHTVGPKSDDHSVFWVTADGALRSIRIR